MTRALLAVALPVLLTGGLAAVMLGQDMARTDAAARATVAASRIDAVLVVRIAEARTWASSAAVVEAARAARMAPPSQRFGEASASDLRAWPRIAGAADPSREAESFLRRQMAASPWLTEISFTDRNGFDVAATGSASGISRSGEAGWQGAWADGISVAAIERDGPAGLRPLALSVRIADPDGGAPLGVLKTVLATDPIGTFAVIENMPSSGVTAPTRSGGARIVNASAEGNGPTGLAVRAGLGGQGDGFGESFASAVDRLGPAEAVLREFAAMIPDRAAVFAGIEDALGDWRVRLVLALLSIGILSAAFAAVLAGAVAGRYAAALDALTELAERSARGEPVRMAPVETPREIVRLGDAVYRLGRLRNRVRDPRPVGSAHAR
ncbi:MAG: hypothetical protein OXM60_03030 [Defluviicoccus sp.]|nr:hypothetical protein [Defluviicoccus sp.]